MVSYDKYLNRKPNEILNDIIARIEGIDLRPSSTAFQILSPICQELRNLSLVLLWTMNQTFIKTATNGYLDTLGEQFQFKRIPATTVKVKAEIKGNKVPIGNRFASVGLDESIIYKVIAQGEEEETYYLEGETLNDQANYYTGNLLMIDFINNLKSAKITQIVQPQKDEESDEEYRKRIQENLIAEATDGNIAQYKKWLSEIEGVGKSKVISLWNGDNTVKCTILNDLNQKASEELIQKVQGILDPNSEGLGEGLAPIGAIVTVDTAEEIKINIVAKVVYKEGRTDAPTLKKELEELFSSIAFERTAITYLEVAGRISNNEDIDHITELTLNGNKEDIQLGENNIPVLGDLDVNSVPA